MKIEVWLDFVNPLCYIGKRQLELALEQCSYRDNVFIQFKSYRQHNHANMYEFLTAHYEMPIEQIEEAKEILGRQAAEVGLRLNLSNVQQTNTFDAHRLMKYAAKHQKESILADHLFHAYFADTKQLSDHETLIQLAEQICLNQEDVTEILATRKHTNDVNEDIDLAMELEVKSAPFYVFNEKYALAGVQSIAALNEVLTAVWEEECSTHHVRVHQTNETYYCSGDDDCERG